MNKLLDNIFFKMSMWKLIPLIMIFWSFMAYIMFVLLTPSVHPEMENALYVNNAIYKISASLGSYIGLMMSLGIWVMRENKKN